MTAFIKNLNTVKETLTLLQVGQRHHVLSSVRDGWFSGRRITVLPADEYNQFTATHSRWRGADCRRLHVAEIVSLFQKTLFSFRVSPPDSPLSPLSPKKYIQLMEQGGIEDPQQDIVKQQIPFAFSSQVKEILEIFDQCAKQALKLATAMSKRAIAKRTPTGQESGWARWLLNVQRWIWHLWQSPIKRIDRMKQSLANHRAEICNQMILTAHQRIQTNALALVHEIAPLHQQLQEYYFKSALTPSSLGSLFTEARYRTILAENNAVLFDKPYRKNADYLHRTIQTIQEWCP